LEVVSDILPKSRVLHRQETAERRGRFSALLSFAWLGWRHSVAEAHTFDCTLSFMWPSRIMEKL
jgi:hypothetical protein